MKLKQYSLAILIALIVAFSASSCKEEWDAHYTALPENKSDMNLYDYIRSQPNLSIFAQMLQTAGYDTILSKPQTFTVWAPSNDALSGLNATDPALATEIVKNHITRFSHTTSGITKSVMPMLNGKLIPFEKQAAGYYFNEKIITQPNLATTNGILHIISEYAPYKQNIWEFINSAPGLDSLRTYINSLTVRQFDPDASYKDGVFVDSVFKTTNAVLNRLARLNVEDSTYTALLPDNNAWNQAYAQIFPYYNTTEEDGGVAQQRESTMWGIVKDLFFRNKVESPVTDNPLISTSRTRFYNPEYLFPGLQPNIMSNGYSYVHNNWLLPDTASLFKPIIIEAESSFGRTVSNYTVNVNSGLGSGYEISNGDYAIFRDAALSGLARLYVNFKIPNTLSAKYNIYCVFVPRKILAPADETQYSVKFYLTYVNSSGKLSSNIAVNASNELLTSSAGAATFKTDPTKVDKMLVLKDFEFPFSNTVYTGNTESQLLEQIKPVLRIESVNTSAKDDIYIDCVILEPVL